MPEEFDPAWEYYEPDPEAEYAVTARGYLPAHLRLPLTERGAFDGFYCFEVKPRTSVNKGVPKNVAVTCDDLFRVMWRLGFTAPQIARKFGVCLRTVRATRSRLRLPHRRTSNRSPRAEELMDENGQPLRELSGVARRNVLSLAAAQSRIAAYGPGSFGDVFPRVDAADHAALREWFCRTPHLRPHTPVVPAKNHTVRPVQPPPDVNASYPNGEFCKCGGLMVQTGKCKSCTSCAYSEGSCS